MWGCWFRAARPGAGSQETAFPRFLSNLTLDLNGKKTSELPLATVFGAQTPTVALNAAQAQLRVGVDVSTNVKVGDVLNFGFQLTDRVGHTSNRATVQMKAVAPQSKGG